MKTLLYIFAFFNIFNFYLCYTVSNQAQQKEIVSIPIHNIADIRDIRDIREVQVAKGGAYFLKKTSDATPDAISDANSQFDAQTKARVTIKSIDTHISIRKGKSEGEVKETIKFLFEDGMANSVMRKISLGGTSDHHSAFRLASADVTLTAAKVIPNCLDYHSALYSYEHPYVCVYAYFEPIDASRKEVEIEYEFTSENLLRKREKPFSSREEENVIVWIYDNYKTDSAVDKVNLEISFENFDNEIQIDRVTAYPEKFISKSNKMTIDWSVPHMKPNSFKNFALNIPLFNSHCKGMNEVHLEITTYSMIQFFIWMTVSIGIISLLSYLYISKGKKEDFEDSNESNACTVDNNTTSIK